MRELPPIEQALAELDKPMQAPAGVRQYPTDAIDEQAPMMPQAPQMQAPAMPALPPIEEALQSLDSLPPTPSAPMMQDSAQTNAPQIEPVRITQTFGQRSPYDVFSGGVNTGVDYATAVGTPVILPQGDWKIEEAFAQAQPTGGYIGNNVNQGYGNSVVAVNTQTGEKLRLSHLSEVNVKPGDTIPGGQVGLTGASGNVTGSHLDFELRDKDGRLVDPLNSPYGNIIPHR